MKRIFLNLLVGVLCVLAVSCQSDKRANTNESLKTTTKSDTTNEVNQADSLAAPVADHSEYPQFSFEKANEGLAYQDQLKKDLVMASKAKDLAMVKTLNDKFRAWILEYGGLGNKMSPKEGEQYIAHLEKLIREWDELKKKAK